RSPIPAGTLEDLRLALDPAAVGLLDVVSSRCEDVEDQPPAWDEQLAGSAERGDSSLLVREMKVGPERTRGQAYPLGDRRGGQVAEPEVEQLRNPGFLRAAPANLEHSGGRVDADHADPCRRRRHGNSTCADAELDARPAAAHSLGHAH